MNEVIVIALSFPVAVIVAITLWRIEVALDDLRDVEIERNRRERKGVRELINEIKRLRAERQTCKAGHPYLANSHEYPCPICRTERLEAIAEAAGGEDELRT